MVILLVNYWQLNYQEGKTLKKSLVVLTVLLSLFAGVAMASANSGSAIIPLYQASLDNWGHRYMTWVHLSNITNQELNIEVILYKSDGTILTDTDNDPFGGSIHSRDNLLNYYDNLTDASLSFTLGPNSSARFGVYDDGHPRDNIVRGYGVIKWQQNSKAPCAIVAHAIGYYANLSSGQILGHNMFAIPINNGLPF